MNAAVPARLPKREKLCSKKDIDVLLSEGKYRSVDGLRMCYVPRKDGTSRILVSVSKRIFRRAVKRNRMKRLIRESYRLQKGLLAVPSDIMFIFSGRDLMTFEEVYDRVGKLLQMVK